MPARVRLERWAPGEKGRAAAARSRRRRRRDARQHRDRVAATPAQRHRRRQRAHRLHAPGTDETGLLERSIQISVRLIPARTTGISTSFARVISEPTCSSRNRWRSISRPYRATLAGAIAQRADPERRLILADEIPVTPRAEPNIEPPADDASQRRA